MKKKLTIHNLDLEITSDDSRDEYTLTKAADYLGCHFKTLRYHLKEGHIREDKRIGVNLVFYKSTLDRFKAGKRKQGRPRRIQNRS